MRFSPIHDFKVKYSIITYVVIRLSVILSWAGLYSGIVIPTFYFFPTKMFFLNETIVLADEFFLNDLTWQKNGSNHMLVPRICFEIEVVHEIQKSS